MKKEYVKILRIVFLVLLLIVWVTIETVSHTPQFRIYRYFLYGVELLLGIGFLLVQKARVCPQCKKVYFTKEARCPGCGQKLVKLSKENDQK